MTIIILEKQNKTKLIKIKNNPKLSKIQHCLQENHNSFKNAQCHYSILSYSF